MTSWNSQHAIILTPIGYVLLQIKFVHWGTCDWVVWNLLIPTIHEIFMFNIYSNSERNFLEVEAYSNHIHNYFKIITHSLFQMMTSRTSSFQEKKSLNISQWSYFCPRFQTNLHKSFSSHLLFFFFFLSWSALWHMWKFLPIRAIFTIFPFCDS